MVKRLFAMLLALMLVFSLCACSDAGDSDFDEDAYDFEEDEDFDETPDPQAQPHSDDNPASSDGRASGLQMKVNSGDGALQIERAMPADGETGEAGVWTVFVYLCGTDLESESAMGTGDLEEMCDAETGDLVRFVVQTGGTETWNNELVDSSCIERYIVQNGSVALLDQQPLTSMGSTDTLADFLRWGLENYASEHMGLIFWNHGGGSITGVCFDETADGDSLDLKELDAALGSSCGAFGRRFDFIGFDACLMGTVEVANIAATYADYLYGSEEVEPGSGWDYAAIGSFLGENPDADAAALGKVVCDSFLAACAAADDDELTTLTVVDLNKLDPLLVAFNDFAKNLYEAAGDSSARARMVRAIGQAENFGGNNKSEGYTNMVDLGGLIAACADDAAGAEAALAALRDAVVYSVSGPAHTGASGLSLYYPLRVQGSQELSIFGAVSVSPYYVSFVDRQNQNGASPETEEAYDDEQWFDEGGDWNWGEEEDGYWDYLDDYAQTGESPYISFETPAHLDEDGSFWFVLDDDGWNNAADVYGIVYQISEDGADIIELGQTYDIEADWDEGYFQDLFDGWWISLPDGQNLATYIVERDEDAIIYTAPILLNGEPTNLRLKLDADGITVEGAWDGLSETGAAAREIRKLQQGDVIVPCYYAYELEGDGEFEYVGQEYIVSGKLELEYGIMVDGDYCYAFCIDDIYGDYYLTEFAMFNLEDGEVSFYQE